MKKLVLLTMFLAVILVFTDCQSTSKTTNESRSAEPSAALDEVTVSSSKKDASHRSTPSPKPIPEPKESARAYRGDKGRLTLSSKTDYSDNMALEAPRTAEPPPPPAATSPASVEGLRFSADTRSESPKATPPPPPPPALMEESVVISGHSEKGERDASKKRVLKGEGFGKRYKKDREKKPEPKPEPLPKARQLTAGEVNDFSKWDLWTDLSQEDLAEHAERWSMLPEKRYAVQVTTEEGAPLTNVPVELQSKPGKVLWKAKTDNTGKAELWNKMFDKTNASAYKIVVKHKGQTHDLTGISIFHEGVNTMQIPVACKAAKSQVDIAFVVDATGSMGDEITYLKAELNDVIQRVKDEMPDTRVNLGSVFYRDTGDRYLTRKSDFSTDISKTIDFIKTQNADGGGDYPEAVEDALDVALNELKWSDESTSRLMFLVLDAPPHSSAAVKEKMKTLTRKAAEKGVRIIPVACSDIRKGTEYLMRTLALATNGTYTFLTDDSGIGGAHIEPTTDEYKVELLNDLLVRIITQFSEIPDCDERYDDVIDDIVNGQNNQQIVWEYYPNPTKGPFTVKSEENIQEVFVTDLNGKLLMRRTGSRTQNFQLDISDFPSGVYVVKCHFDNDKWETGRIVLVRG